MKKKFFILMILAAFFCSGCFSEKDSPFYDSEWIMKNYDAQGLLYYHHLILQPGNKVMLRASYADSTNIIVWTGKYKINSKKIVFDFTECIRYENNEVIGKYTSGKLTKYYTGDFLYSVAQISDSTQAGEGEKKQSYHLQLIRPQNYFYGEGKDIFGNQLEEFIKVK